MDHGARGSCRRPIESIENVGSSRSSLHRLLFSVAIRESPGMKLALGIRLVDVADAEGRQQLGTEHDFRAANGAHRTAALGACTGMVPRLRIVSWGGHENAVEEPSDFGDLA